VGLHIGIRGIEEFLQPVYRKLFNFVNHLAASVISRSGVSLSIFVGEYRTHRLKHLGADKVLRCDKFNTVSLALAFAADKFKYSGVSFHDNILSSVDV